MRGQNQSITPGLVIQIVDDAAFRPSLPFTFLLGSGSAFCFDDWILRLLFLPGHLDELLEVVPHVLGVVEEQVLLHLHLLRLPLPSLPQFLNKMGAN